MQTLMIQESCGYTRWLLLDETTGERLDYSEWFAMPYDVRADARSEYPSVEIVE